jgi:thioredoxin reductase (NADPH)
MVVATDTTAFPTLNDRQLERLADYGDESAVAAGSSLFVEGQASYDLIVILEGEADIIYADSTTEVETVIASHGAGRFLGELSLLTGQRTFLRGRMRSDGRIRRITQTQFRRLLASDPEIGDIIFQALVARREIILRGVSAGSLRLIGSRYSKRSLELGAYMRRQRLAFQWVDVDGDDADDVDVLLASVAARRSDLPVVVTTTETLRNPTVGELASHLGLVYQPTSLEVLDVVVVGAGPAGLAAAVYGASEGLTTLVVDRVGVGGQAGTSSRIENYVGFPSGVSGGDLVERAALQAQRLGAQITSPCSVERIEAVCDGYRLTLGDDAVLMARAVVIALGVQYRKLPLERLEEFEGAGVYYAATDLEARVCGADPVTVIGGGNSAGQAAIFLAQQGSDVTIAIRGADLASSMSSYLIDRIDAAANITVSPYTEVVALHGDTRLAEITLRDNRSGDERRQQCSGLFSFIGAVPFTAWLDGFVELDEKGFVLTDRDLAGRVPDGFEPLPFETSRPGVFAAGDVRSSSMKRVAAAVGDGSSAIRSVHQRLAAP